MMTTIQDREAFFLVMSIANGCLSCLSSRVVPALIFIFLSGIFGAAVILLMLGVDVP